MIFASQEQQETSAETRSPEYKQHQEALNSLQSKRKESVLCCLMEECNFPYLGSSLWQKWKRKEGSSK